MKTTVDIDDVLLPKVKRRAATRGMTLKAFIEEALRSSLLKHQKNQLPYVFDMPVVGGTRPPRVNIADRDQLYDYMDSELSD